LQDLSESNRFRIDGSQHWNPRCPCNSSAAIVRPHRQDARPWSWPDSQRSRRVVVRNDIERPSSRWPPLSTSSEAIRSSSRRKSMVKPILQLYPMIPAADESERAALRPLGRNAQRYTEVLHGMTELVKAADDLG